MNKTEILQALSQLSPLDRREVLVHLLNLTADDVRAEIRPRLHRLVRDDVSLLDQFRTPYFGPPPDLESRLSFSAELVLKPLVALPIPNSLWEPMWMAGAFKLGDLLDTVPANWCREHQCAPELFERLRPLLDHLAVQTGSGSPRLSDGKPTFKGLKPGELEDAVRVQRFRGRRMEIPTALHPVEIPFPELPVRLQRALFVGGFRTWGDLHGCRLRTLFTLRDFGTTSFKDLAEALRKASATPPPPQPEAAFPAAAAARLYFHIPKQVWNIAFSDLPVTPQTEEVIWENNLQILGDLHGRPAVPSPALSDCGDAAVRHLFELVEQAAARTRTKTTPQP